LKFLIDFFIKEREEAQKLYKGKKIKKTEKPKTFIPGDQLDKLTINSQNNIGFSGGQDQQQNQQRVQPSKEDIDAIRVFIF
jgi:hypothetical protein